MAVYFMPRDRNNFWWGGGRGGGGVLDLIGQALIQPMLQRDALARQYKYDTRLADQKHNLDLQLEQARWGRQDDLIDRHDLYVRENPNAIPGTGGATATFLALGGKGDLAQYQPYLLPQSQSIDLGGQVHTRGWNPNGTVVEGATYGKTLSPYEEGQLAVARQEAATKDWAARQQAAINRYIATHNTRGGGGKAPDRFAGINSAANLYEAIGKLRQSVGNGGIEGLTALNGGGAQQPDRLAGTYDLAQYFLRGAIAQALGQAPQGASSFEDVLSANGGLFGGPTLGYYNGGVQPDTDMEDTATIVPGRTPGGEDPEYLGKLGLNPRGWAALAEPAPQISDEAVRRYSQKWGISEEDARNELSQFVSM